MLFSPTLTPAQRKWLSANGYAVISLLAKGKSSGVWLVEKNNKRFAAKCEHSKSTRTQMVQREALQLQMANEVGIGPKLMASAAEEKIIIMHYISGKTLREYIESCTQPVLLEKVVHELFAQAKKLDAAGIDHGQLGGKLANILVDAKNRVHIIDFEKASYVRKTHNVAALKQALFRSNNELSAKVLALIKNSPIVVP